MQADVIVTAVFELPRGWGVAPPTVFLTPLTQSNYVGLQGGVSYTVYIRFTSQFCLVFDRRKVQPQLTFHNSNTV